MQKDLPMSAIHSSPLDLPPLPPLRARLINALISRALPLEFTADAGTKPAAVCRLDVNGGAVASEGGAPFASGADLFLLTGDSMWKVELSSLEALSLRPELAAWRAGEGGAVPSGNDFSALPAPLSLAVLERLFAPALDSLARWLGCETGFCSAPVPETTWADPLPLTLTLPEGERVYLRLFWNNEQAARFVLERLETLPLRAVADAAGALRGAVLRCSVEVGGMSLSPREAAALAPGDILLPERWTPEAPRLLLSGGVALACRLESGVLSVLGPDATLPPPRGKSFDSSEMIMTEAVSEHAEASEHAAEGSRLLDRDAIAALELPVTFELADLNLRVEEIAALAPGYTFALGGDASSVPVFLRIGGRIAARGRLVDVGGIPGVQITGMADAGGRRAEEDADSESPTEGK